MKNSTAFIMLLTSVGLFFTFVSPHYDQVMALRKQGGEYKDILKNIEDLQKERDNLSVEYQNFPQDGIAKLDKVLPANVDTVSLATNLDAIAARYGISIQSVHIIDANSLSGVIDVGNGKAYEPVDVTFAFNASYNNFKNFMIDLEKSLRIADVRSINFSSTENGIYQYNVNITTYWLKSSS